jgi:hypothetical protein
MSQHEATGDESRMGATYFFVILIQIAVTAALWWAGRVFSR